LKINFAEPLVKDRSVQSRTQENSYNSEQIFGVVVLLLPKF